MTKEITLDLTHLAVLLENEEEPGWDDDATTTLWEEPTRKWGPREHALVLEYAKQPHMLNLPEVRAQLIRAQLMDSQEAGE